MDPNPMIDEFKAKLQKLRALITYADSGARPRLPDGIQAALQGQMEALQGTLDKMRDSMVKPRPPRTPNEGQTLAPSGQTPIYVVHKMLEMAEIKPDDVLYDLGSGDGRVVI